ncbi:MAG: DNA mismatch repair protein MutS [Candidatus Zixiibacteriota bacterium]|nr:MAG: DNA mismatch repair protein MutS [candidate division Zixibacteria bacterium]
MMSKKAESTAGFTPLMRQFHAIKEQHPNKILFFRMGDFYEMFGDDAVKAAPILGITLTSRAHGNSKRIPLAGVPYHAADRYLAKLLGSGLKVVVVEQVEDPKTAKGLVKRDVVEILTPGTSTIDTPEAEHRSASLAAVYVSSGRNVGLAMLDITTGAFLVDQGPAHNMLERLAVLEPQEILFPAETGRQRLPGLFEERGFLNKLSEYEEWNFDYKTATRELNRHFQTSTLEGFGISTEKAAVASAGAILRYLKDNHRDQLLHVKRLTKLSDAEFMTLDYSTVRNLELVKSIAGANEENTLFSVMNQCNTTAGARRLRNALVRPFVSKERIERRLSGVGELVRNRDLCFKIIEETKQLPDLERLAGRLGLGKLNPRQMAGIGQALSTADRLRVLLREAHSPLLANIGQSIPESRSVVGKIESALTDEPPLVSSKGKIFRRSYSGRLDELNDSIKFAREYISSLQQTERERTGISSLKVGFNKVFGYYIEITRANDDLVPDQYIRKQTLVNAERYITPELKEKEELIFAAEDKIMQLESELYGELVEFLNGYIGDIVLTAELLAEIDLVCGLAELAVQHGYCRPEIFEDTRFNLQNGRHPVVEAVLPAGSFVANDVSLSSDMDQIMILTGPNMSGKSTYLRQIGLIAVMAQIGSFVPADKAEIGLVDRVFTRVGALDNLAGGQSTFLVEMVETANILNNASERSLVLLDEVGRGTSTFDGLSVAWSVVERINEDCRSRTVFATHYHELTGMAALCDRVRNFQVAVKEWEGRVVFLHKIIPGGCDDSYGIEVARLAGLPRATITRAKQVLRLLESGKFTQSELGKSIYKEKVQTSMFDAQPSLIEEKLRKTDMDNMTPVEAFELLRKLKENLK